MTSLHKDQSSNTSHRYFHRSSKHHNSTILQIAFNHRQFYYLLVVIYLLSISNPDTYICDAANAHLDTAAGTEWSNSSESTSSSSSLSPSTSISCTLLLREHDHYLNIDRAQQTKARVHVQSADDAVTSPALRRYHPYYHYSLSETYESSLGQQLGATLSTLQSWYRRFSLVALWNAIPSKWKMTALSIAILDIGFLIVIKTLVFEDNYAV
mmetsp:Transcript_46998/g.75261  ORF Transcript_46998/g.75261 Transcript_46998/m.75261 type:complete len:211 (-) Transcript_46998:579-1211(-)|eukprot:CAMPEP_0197044752 /NCGR_PEP_ID=MMETSP1384-20130603/20744_1 /TAXON_ID=29189 /ORGANISM="Ammonia sp." /LENGTH=210 /DNA_ID=CAMNT_0042476263 /DNA_START=126 /DNA_END=758 /DNA_ORIENTATION=-